MESNEQYASIGTDHTSFQGGKETHETSLKVGTYFSITDYYYAMGISVLMVEV